MYKNNINVKKMTIKALQELKKLGVAKVVFTPVGEIAQVEFFAKSVENSTIKPQSGAKSVKKTEEQLQNESDLAQLRRATALDDLMLEDPAMYEEEIFRQGMIDGDNAG